MSLAPEDPQTRHHSEPLRYTLPYAYRRRLTFAVMVGSVGVGGRNPIRVQSMTTTRTQDVDATVAQVRRLVDVGCEIVRITAPTVADSRALGTIKTRLSALGITVPLVADIHFSPAAALEAAEHVHKVRINPGNYADSKAFTVREYSDSEYAAELDRIRERFLPLVVKCRERGIAMRIGTNHGSLSDRIMNRFGDTPLGMVESALEFVQICRDLDYHDIIFSMKASNPKVMIHAYRLLAARLDALGWRYPLHLGVTEAGDGEDGRAKSAIGIGSLLDDGLGDTVRVSLTEDPEAEIPVAFALVAPYNGDAARERERRFPPRPDLPDSRDPFAFERRRSVAIPNLDWGGASPSRVMLDEEPSWLDSAGQEVPPPDLIRVSAERAAAMLRTVDDPLLAVALTEPSEELPAQASLVISSAGSTDAGANRIARVRKLPLLLEAAGERFEAVVDALLQRLSVLSDSGLTPVLALRLIDRSSVIRGYRLLAAHLAERSLEAPLHLVSPPVDDLEAGRLEAAVALGALLADGIGDSVEIPGSLPASQRLELAYTILQGAGARITRTEYVACPSCGRTLFDLQETTGRIRDRTGHLKGVKIAIMGCVVNGPGEMADADFGYVGGAPGKVNLYVGREVVERSVAQERADDRLIEVIKSRGRWVEPGA